MLKNSKQFAAFRRKVEGDFRLKGLPLEALFIKPVQRICRYPLLLGELKKKTPDFFPSFERLGAVVEKVVSAVTTINEIRRECEMTARAFELQNKWEIEGMEQFKFCEGERRLLREEISMEVSYTVSNSVKTCSAAFCWMFTDCLVFCAPKKKKKNSAKLLTMIQISPNLSVREFPLNPEKGLVNFLEFSEKSVSVILRFPNEQLMTEWKTAVSNVVSVQAASMHRHLIRQEEKKNRSTLTDSSSGSLRLLPPRGGEEKKSGGLIFDMVAQHNQQNASTFSSDNPPRPNFEIIDRMPSVESEDTQSEASAKLNEFITGDSKEDKELKDFFSFK